jgi:carbon-monoxide dehydrogenase small subunit
MDEARDISVRINGSEFRRHVNVRTTLADFLRHQLGLTGTHLGCEHGVCGACTVLIEGQSARSCLMLAVQANGMQVTTVEGLGDGPRNLNPLQEAFRAHHALQCGFCTPGILMSLTELLNTNPDPTENEVRDVLSGHLCRCTGYQSIVAACLGAARAIRGAARPESNMQ